MLKLLFSRKNREQNCVYWWKPRSGENNAGDHLSKVIVQQMLSLKDKEILDKKDKKNKLMAIGSVMHFAKDKDTVWGTGVNGKIEHSLLNFKTLDVRSVRGPLTREILQKKGIDVPEIYGDPGLLLPLFFSKNALLNFEQPANDFIIIPHMNEDLTVYEKYKDNVCTPRKGALEFTRDIVNSKFVISGSLHGVIIAEAYGIPAIYLDNNSGETRFKYDDYYYGTGRTCYPVVKTIEEAFSSQLATNMNYEMVVSSLIKSFPYDLW